ncbi:putative secondary metabolism biosynthetic enzyme [Amphichorda felina]
MPAPYDTHTTTGELVADYDSLINGKVILITGVSQGSLGGFFVESIAKAKPSRLILAGRNADKLSQIEAAIIAAQPGIKVSILQVDLGSLENVRNAAAQVNSWNDIPAIDVLVNNAGIMAEGKTYNRWYAYGQSKTANMLFAISLAQKIGVKHNLQAFSLHPGVIWTNLGSHIDWSVEMDELLLKPNDSGD